MHHSFGNITLGTADNVPTVFLPGWGFDGQVLSLIKPMPNWIYPETMLDPQTLVQDLFDFLEEENIERIRMIGWSMGARLALDFASCHAGKVDSLVLVSLRHRWPRKETEQLGRELADDSIAFLKTFYRKCFIGDKSSYTQFTRQMEPRLLNLVDQPMIARLQSGLEYLSNQDGEIPPAIPTKLIHGRKDVIAPVEEIANLDDATVEIVKCGGHLPFLADECSLRVEINHKAIRKEFSRAAGTYDQYAMVQSQAGKKLAARLPADDEAAKIHDILELGCGTGNYTRRLSDHFPDAKIVALDFSAEMLELARLKQEHKDIRYVCAEAEHFLTTIDDQSFDLVTSNGALQWFADHDRSFRNIARILRPAGMLQASIFGTDSLQELELGMQSVFGYTGKVAAAAFPRSDVLARSLASCFTDVILEEELIVKQYETVHSLLAHIKKTGTSGMQHHTPQLLTPSRLLQLDKWFSETYGSCQVTYQLHFLRAIK